MHPLEQTIRFCTAAGGVRIAYATVGEGPPLVKTANWLSHLEFDWNSPVWRHWLRELGRHRTLVRYDERGCGLSDWSVQEFSLDAWVSDLEAVVDALGLERFPLLGMSQGGPIAIAYAVRHPARVTHLILYGTYLRGRAFRSLSEEERQERDMMIQMVRLGWGKDHAAFRQVFTSLFIPDGTAEQAGWFNELQRVSATPENAARMLAAFDVLDVRKLAGSVRVPTLVLHARGDLRVPFSEGRRVATHIPNARFVPLESRNHLLLEGEPAWPRFLHAVRSFLGDPTTDPARRELINAVLDDALDLEAAARPAFLRRRCEGDGELEREVRELLDSAERTGLTARLAGAVAAPVPASSGPASAVQSALPKYEVLDTLGVGGMGVVYKARDRRLGRLVAVKLLAPSYRADRQIRERFLQEAKAAASLDHANICAIYEVEEGPDGELFIVMPCYEGEILRQKIGRGPLPLAEAIDYAVQVGEGLAHAHAAGIVHRDIKPANVAVTPGGRVKILDFGIAKVADAELTRPGTVLGTLAYMSPEQASGEPVDHRTDLWALGVVLYEMLTGRQPFTAESREALFYAIQYREPAPLAELRKEVPAEVEAVVRRLLAKDPARRYADAREAVAALRAAVQVPSS